MHTPSLMAVLAHPDDESLGVGGALAKYASEGVDVFLVTATRGDRGRYHGHGSDDPQHPGPSALARIREGELRAAASVLGVREVSLLDYHDQHLDRADPLQAVADIVEHVRRIRPDVVVTFGADGAYGHPDAVWRAVSCHTSQVAAYDRLRDLSPEHHEALWGRQSFYRVFSTVNGGRARETDLFEGITR